MRQDQQEQNNTGTIVLYTCLQHKINHTWPAP